MRRCTRGGQDFSNGMVVRDRYVGRTAQAGATSDVDSNLELSDLGRKQEST